MSNLTRWEPAGNRMTLRDAMDRIFDDAFTQPISLGSIPALPAIDLYVTQNEVVVKADLPGLKAEDVQISVTGNALTLRGEYKRQDEKKEATYHINELRYGAFERMITLPVEVQTDKARADFENGVLSVTLPKSEKTKPKSISIRAK